ncbi:MAG TPA: hypothetical protein VFD84_02620, partial [Candidatus Binatia bacterium]|nr:hypothetical protein [Candidatus Binatia bacterium]
KRLKGKRCLRRTGPLPDELLPLPEVEEVEGFFYGVPAPRWTECFKEFISDFSKMGPQGVTAEEWAARVGQPVSLVRHRLDVLVQGGTLVHDPQSGRYAVNSAP